MSIMPGETLIFGLAFLAQVMAAARLLFRVNRSRQQLDSVRISLSDEDRDAAVSGEVSTKPLQLFASAFDWSEAIFDHAALPPLERAVAPAYVFGEWFQSLLSYRFLERMTVVAPLLGLLVTCWGLFGGRVNLDDIQNSMRPLVLGVGGGAAIALANQCFLFVVQSRASAVQHASRAILRQQLGVERNSQEPTAGPGFLTAPFLEALRVATERNDELVHVLQHLNERFIEQADSHRAAVAALLNTVGVLPAHLSALAKSIDGAETVFASSASTFTEVAATLQKDVCGFSDIISSQLTPLVSGQAAHLDALKKISTASREAIEGLGETVGLLKAAALRHEDITKAYRESVEEVVIPSQKQVRDAASKIGNAARALTIPLEGLITGISDLGARVESGSQSFEQLRRGAELFSEVVDQALAPALQHHLAYAGDLQKSAAQVLAAAEEIRSGASGLDVSSMYQAATTDRMLAVIEQKMIPTYSLLERTALSLEGAVQMFVEHSDHLRRATLEQADSASGLRAEVAVVVKSFAEAGQRLAKHDDAVSEPLAAVTALIKHTSDLTKQIEPVIRVMQAGVDALRTALSESANAKTDLAKAMQANEATAKVLATSANAIRDTAQNVGLIRSDAAEVVMPYLKQLHEEIDKVRRVSVLNVAASEVSAAVAGAIQPLKASIDVLAANVGRNTATQENKRGWFR